MKKLLFILIACSLYSCNTKDYNYLNGKWGTVLNNGDYSEIWVDDNYILLFDEVGYYPFIYEYDLKEDSIIPLNYVVKDYCLLVKSLDESELILTDSYKEYDFYRISLEVKIDRSKAFEDKFYEEIRERFDKHLKDSSKNKGK